MKIFFFIISFLYLPFVFGGEYCKEGFSFDSLSSAIKDADDTRYSKDSNYQLIDDSFEKYNRVFNSCLKGLTSDDSYLESLNQRKLHVLYIAAFSTQFYTGENKQIKFMEKIIDLKTKFGEGLSEKEFELYNAYYINRYFKDADRVFNKYHLENKYLELHGGDEGSSVRHVIYKGNLKEVNDFPNIILVSSPKCHFSIDFLDWVEKNKNFRGEFFNNTLLLFPNDTIPGSISVLKFRNKYILANYAIVYKKKEWPEIKYWGTPTFYFYRNGVLEKQVVGASDKKLIERLVSEYSSN